MYHKKGEGRSGGFGFEGFSFVKPSSASESKVVNTSGTSFSKTTNLGEAYNRKTGFPETSSPHAFAPASGFAAMSMGYSGNSGVNYGTPGRTFGYHTNIGKRRVRSEEQ